MKKLSLVIILGFCLSPAFSQYLPSYSTGYDANYININKSNFSPYGTTTFDDNQKHVMTILNLTYKMHSNLMSYYGTPANPPSSFTISNLKNTPAYKYDRIVKSNGLIMRKAVYARNHVTNQPDSFVRMLIIRPDDTIKRPCIMITNGANSLMGNTENVLYQFYPLLSEMALRGFVVVFYESLSNDLSIISNLTPSNYPCSYKGTLGSDPTENKRNIERNAYANFQYGVAAYNYILNDSRKSIVNRIINADSTEINAVGFSMGGFTSLMLAFSRHGVNYTNYYRDFYVNCSSTLVSDNNFTKLCTTPNATSDINIKSVVSVSGGLPDSAGAFFTTVGGVQPRKIPALLMYGRYDNLVGYNNNLINYSFPAFTIDAVRKSLKGIGVPTKLYVNCNGNHPYYTDFSSSASNKFGTSAGMAMSGADYISLNNTISSSSGGITTFTNDINASSPSFDNQSKYQSFIFDGNCLFLPQFRTFTTQFNYVTLQMRSIVTMMASFFKDVRVNTLTTMPYEYYNNSSNVPIYTKTNNYYSNSMCGINAFRVVSAQTDAYITSSTACPCTIKQDGTEDCATDKQYSRLSKPKNEINPDNHSIEMYPNPVSDILTLNLNMKIGVGAILSVYSIEGELMERREINEHDSNSSINIDISSYVNNTYILSVRNGNETYNSKFVVIH